jgi:hypothetical protein
VDSQGADVGDCVDVWQRSQLVVLEIAKESQRTCEDEVEQTNAIL